MKREKESKLIGISFFDGENDNTGEADKDLNINKDIKNENQGNKGDVDVALMIKEQIASLGIADLIKNTVAEIVGVKNKTPEPEVKDEENLKPEDQKFSALDERISRSELRTLNSEKASILKGFPGLEMKDLDGYQTLDDLERNLPLITKIGELSKEDTKKRIPEILKAQNKIISDANKHTEGEGDEAAKQNSKKTYNEIMSFFNKKNNRR